MSGDETRIPVLYLAPWVSIGGSDTGTIDWFEWLDTKRFAASLITTQPSPNLRLDEVVPHADEVWALPDFMPGLDFPAFILGFIETRKIRLVHIMNSRLAFDLLPDIWLLPDRPATVVQLHVEEPHGSGYPRYVATRYGNLVDAFSVSSHHLAATLAEYDMPASKCRVIRTGVDAEETFNPERVQPVLPAAEGTANILFCGRLAEQKDPLLMVKVAGALRDRGGAEFRIHCVGGGHLEPQVRAAIDEGGLGDHILLHGDQDDVPRWYRSADLVLMTSAYEGVPYVAYEAMAMGVPIVAPALPGNVELMGEGCGILISEREGVAGYVDAISTLIHDSDRRVRLGAEARERVRRSYSLAAMAQGHGELYAELLSANPAPAEPPGAVPLPEPLRLPRPEARGSSPLVSAVIPCYGHGRYLRECLASIRAQSYSPIEMIVVDDGSSDSETAKVLPSLDGEADVTVLRLATNSGPSAARNTGIAAAKGSFILPVDADNVLLSGAVALLVEQLQQAGETIGFIYPNREYFGNQRGYVHAPAYNLDTLLRTNFCDTCSLIDRRVFDAGLRYAEDMRLGHEDWDFVLQLAAWGIRGEVARGPTVRVRRSGFPRSDLVDRAGLDGAGAMASRHPGLYGRHPQIKSEWSPGLSLVLLDSPASQEAALTLAERIAGQTCADAEVIIRPATGVEQSESGPRVRHSGAGPELSRAEAARQGLGMARGRIVCVHEGSGEELLGDRAAVEKLTRIAESGVGALALTGAAAGSGHRWQRLSEAEYHESQAHTAAWRRLDAPSSTVELPHLHPVSGVVRSLAGQLPLRWHQHPAPRWEARESQGRGCSVVLGALTLTAGDETEEWARLNQPPRLPGLPRMERWVPPRTSPLFRHWDPSTGRRIVSTESSPGEAFILEYDLGYINASALSDTVPLVVGPELSFRTLGPEERPLEGEITLGHLEARPLPLMDAVHIARCPNGALTLVAGEDDPLMGIAEPLHRLGWIEPSPLRPRELRRVDDLREALSHTESLLVGAERDRRELLARLGALGQSGATQVLADRIHRGARRLLPHGSRRGSALAAGVRATLLLTERGPGAVAARLAERTRRRRRALPVTDDTEYAAWLQSHDPDECRLSAMRLESTHWDYRPLVSIVMPAYDPPISWLQDAIDSVKAQSYTNWELCIADDHSLNPEVRTVLEGQAAMDPRIRVVFRTQNGGISAASNTALEQASGEFVAFLDHDDVLRPHALHALVRYLQEHRTAGLIYSDEDKLRPDGTRGLAFFKPDWSPDLLLSCNYICHLCLIRRELVTGCEGFRSEYDGSQDHDLFLRVTETGCEVGHVPDVLYSWRQVEGSAALSAEAKPYAYAAAERAIADSLRRRNLPGRVVPTATPGWFHVRYPLAESSRVTIIIPTRDRLDLLEACVDSIVWTSTYDKYEIVIVDNDSRDTATRAYLRASEHRVLRHGGPFNYSQIMNHAVATVDADHLVFLNNDTSVLTPDWLQAMLEQSQRPEIGAVGARLLFPDGRVQHEGIVVGRGAPARNSTGYFGLGRAIREVGAVTGACMMIARAKFEAIGGFDERLRVCYNDVDLCLRLRADGYRIIYTAAAELCHDEGSSRGAYNPPQDEAYFAERWGPWQLIRDPYVNINIASLSPFRLAPS